MHLVAFTLLTLACYCEVTIQEELPLIDKQFQKGKLFELQITQNQIARYYISPQTNITNTLPKECHIHPAYISVTPISQLKVQPNQLSQLYSFNTDQRSLYQLNDKSLTKYQMNWHQKTLRKENTLAFDNQCSKSMIEQWQQQKIYVFSCDKILKIGANLSILAQIRRKQGNFTPFKVVRFQEFIFQVSANEGVNIYKIDFKAQIQLIGNIKMYYNHTLHIADIFYHNNVLYILDYKQGPLLYQPKAQFFQQKDKISFKFKQNVQFRYLIIERNSLFVALSKIGESIVAQLAFIGQKLFLVRYFKGYSSIQKISIFENKLLIESELKIELLPINRDPRMIHQMNNGYTYTHDIKVRELNYLQDNIFLLSSEGNLQILAWNVKDLNIQCVFPETGTYQLKFNVNCGQRQTQFYQVCIEQQQLQIYVGSSHKDNYFWLLLIVSGVFILAVTILIIWRNDQAQKITKIIRKIKQYKQRLQPKKETIEFEEVEHAYSVDMRTHSEGFKESDHKELNQEEVKNQNSSENEQQEEVGESERRQLSHG